MMPSTARAALAAPRRGLLILAAVLATLEKLALRLGADLAAEDSLPSTLACDAGAAALDAFTLVALVPFSALTTLPDRGLGAGGSVLIGAGFLPSVLSWREGTKAVVRPPTSVQATGRPSHLTPTRSLPVIQR